MPTTAPTAVVCLRQSLVDAPGAQAYPLAGYQYLVVNAKQPDANTALALRTFFAWLLDQGDGA